jgi:LmbE family N-acetylglucosaminyl deacetylase
MRRLETFLSYGALAVFAHPDDAELACYGALARLRQAGLPVHLVTASPGSRSSSESKDRVAEARTAAALIDAHLISHELTDGDVGRSPDLYSKISGHLAALKPRVLFTHFPGASDHQDHVAVGSAATTLGLHAPSVEWLLQCEPPVMSRQFCPTTFIDVASTLDVKLAAVKCHTSEAWKPFMREESLIQRARWWGRMARPHHDGEPLAYEAFVAVKLLIEHSRANLWGTDEPPLA